MHIRRKNRQESSDNKQEEVSIGLLQKLEFGSIYEKMKEESKRCDPKDRANQGDSHDFAHLDVDR